MKNFRQSVSYTFQATINSGSLNINNSINLGTALSGYCIEHISLSLLFIDSSNQFVDGACSWRMDTLNSANNYSNTIPGLSSIINRPIFVCQAQNSYQTNYNAIISAGDNTRFNGYWGLYVASALNTTCSLYLTFNGYFLNSSNN